MANNKGIVSSVDDFEDIVLDMDDISDTSVVEKTTLGDVKEESLELDLGDLPKETKTGAGDIDLELDLGDEPEPMKNVVAPPVTEAPFDVAHKETVAETKEALDGIELDLELEEVVHSTNPVISNIKEALNAVAETPKEAPKKSRGRPKKGTEPGTDKPKETSKPVDEIPPTSTKFLDPEFPIEKISEDETYQTRVKALTVESISELATLIENQGQIEPIRLLEQDGKYIILAGFRRYNACKKLGKKTVMAIVHRGLSDVEIYQISTGSNSGRLDLSDTDKILSIGQYASAHFDKSIEELVPVFGYAKSTIYAYMAVHKFLKKNKQLLEFVKPYNFPLHVYQTIMAHTKTIENIDETMMEKITFFLQSKNIDFENKAIFELKFSTLISETVLDKKIQAEETNAAVDDLDLDTGEDGDKTVADMIQDAQKKEVAEKQATVDETKVKITGIITNIQDASALMEGELTELLAIEKFRNYTDIKVVKSIHKTMSKINDLLLKLL